MKRLFPTAGALLALVVLSSCGYSVASDMTAVQEGRGAEAKKVKGCKPPNERAWFGNDFYAYYPTNEREWDATGQEGSDSGRFKSVTDDSVEMYVPVTVRFSFITECETLTEFYTRYGRRYGAYLDEDGNYNDEQQWKNMLRKLIADPADAQLDRIVQGYKWRDVWNDPGTKTEIEVKLDDALTSDTSLLVQTAQGKFFEDISVLIGTPKPVQEALAEAVALEQTNVAKAQSAEAQAKADEAKARAQVAVARAEAAKKEAEIAGYGSVENYLKAQAVEKGINPWQPTYLYGGAPR